MVTWLRKGGEPVALSAAESTLQRWETSRSLLRRLTDLFARAIHQGRLGRRCGHKRRTRWRMPIVATTIKLTLACPNAECERRQYEPCARAARWPDDAMTRTDCPPEATSSSRDGDEEAEAK